MPNKASAIKRVRQNERRYIRNRAARSAMRTSIKKFNKAVEATDVAALPALLVDVQSKLGKAAKTNLIKKKTMSRRQSRLMKAANKAKLAQAQAG